jgi:WD40 repeat protein
LFDTATGEVVETIRNVPNMTTQHTYDGKFQTSPDGKMLAAGGSDGTVCVWDLGAGRAANGAPALVFRSHTSEISRVEFHPDGSRLFSADMDGMVKVWDVVTRDRPVVIQEAANFAGPVAFSATSGRLLTIYHPRAPKAGNGKKGTPDEANKPGPVPMEKSKITVWDLTGKPLASFASPVPGFNNGRGYHPIVLSRDGTRLALISSVGSGPRDGAELHIIEADTGKEVFMRKIGEAGSLGTAAPAFSRDGKQIALGFAEAAEGREKFSPRSGPAHVKLLDSSDGTEIRRIAVGEGAIQSLAFSPDGSRLALATGGFQTKPAITIWDVRTGERLVKLVSKWQPTEALLFSDDGTRLASIVRGFGFDQKNEVFVWDAATGKTLLTLPGHSSRFLNIAFSPNGRRIATATSSGPRYGSGTPGTRQGNEIKLWDAATGDELMTLKDLDRNTAGHLSFSADGTRLYAVGGSNQSVRDGKIELRTWDATPRR